MLTSYDMACRCVLKVPLPRWPVSGDYLTVWKRCDTCVVRDAVDSEADDDEDGDQDKINMSETGQILENGVDVVDNGEQKEPKVTQNASRENSCAGAVGQKITHDGTQEIWDGQSDPYGLTGLAGSPVASPVGAGGSGEHALPAGAPASLLCRPGLTATKIVVHASAKDEELWDGVTDPYALMAQGEDLPDSDSGSEEGEGVEGGSGDIGSGGNNAAGESVPTSQGEDGGELWDGGSDPYGGGQAALLDDSKRVHKHFSDDDEEEDRKSVV